VKVDGKCRTIIDGKQSELFVPRRWFSTDRNQKEGFAIPRLLIFEASNASNTKQDLTNPELTIDQHMRIGLHACSCASNGSFFVADTALYVPPIEVGVFRQDRIVVKYRYYIAKLSTAAFSPCKELLPHGHEMILFSESKLHRCGCDETKLQDTTACRSTAVHDTFHSRTPHPPTKEKQTLRPTPVRIPHRTTFIDRLFHV